MHKKGYILVIGGSNADISGIPTEELVPEDSNPGSVTISAGGVGRNIAENIARLQIPVRLLSAVGDDYFGNFIKAVSKASGIDTGELITFKGASSSAYLCIMEQNRDMNIAVNDMKIMEKIEPAEIRAREELLSGAEMVVIDNNLRPETIDAVKSAGCRRLLFDAVSGKKLERTKDKIYNIDTVKLNSIEAEILSGIEVHDTNSAYEAGGRILERGINNIFITLGPNGAVYLTENGRWYMPPYGLPVANTTGAGDAFLAGVAWGLYKGLDGSELLEYGSACAAAAAASERTVAENMSPERIKEIINGD